VDCPKCGTETKIALAKFKDPPYDVHYCPSCNWVEEYKDNHVAKVSFNPSFR